MIVTSHGILLGKFTLRCLKSLGEGDGDKVYFFLVTVQTSHKALLVHSLRGNVIVHSSAAPSLFNDRQPGDPGTA